MLCARFAFGAGGQASARSITDTGLDWERLIALAERHGLSEVLYRRLSGLDPNPVPKTVFVRLWEKHVTAVRSGKAMTAELLQLLKLFEENGIPAVPFKGPVLAFELYGDVALREYGDLDILVPVGDVPQARDLVEARGYVSDYPLSARWDGKLLTDSVHHSLSHRYRGDGLLLELHWRTSCPLLALPDTDEVWWTRRPPLSFEGRSLRSLTAEELLYILCMHGARHGWQTLGAIRDVASTIGRYADIDWRKVLGLADRKGTLRIVLLAVTLAHQLMDAAVPEEVRGRIAADGAVPAMAERIVRRLGLSAFSPLSGSGLSFALAWSRFWPPWVGFELGRVLRPNMADWCRWDLPPALSPLYYPLHLARLFVKHGMRPERKFAGA